MLLSGGQGGLCLIHVHPAKGPIRAGIGVGDDLLLTAAVGVHNVDAPAPTPRTSEHDAPVGRPGWQRVWAGRVGQAMDIPPVGVHDIDIYVAAHIPVEGDLTSIGGPTGVHPISQTGEVAAVRVHRVDSAARRYLEDEAA